MSLYGPKPFSRMCDTSIAALPWGGPCRHCSEPILKTDKVSLVPELAGGTRHPFHDECITRMTVGSVGHQLRECECFGDEDTSEKGLTLREAAKRAAEHYMKTLRSAC